MSETATSKTTLHPYFFTFKPQFFSGGDDYVQVRTNLKKVGFSQKLHTDFRLEYMLRLRLRLRDKLRERWSFLQAAIFIKDCLDIGSMIRMHGFPVCELTSCCTRHTPRSPQPNRTTCFIITLSILANVISISISNLEGRSRSRSRNFEKADLDLEF